VVTLLVLSTKNVKLARLVGLTVIPVEVAAHPEVNTAAATVAILTHIFMAAISDERPETLGATEELRS